MWLPTSSGEPPTLESLSRLWPGIEGEYRSPSCRARLPRPWRDESPSTTLGWDAIGEAVYAQKRIQPRDQGTPQAFIVLALLLWQLGDGRLEMHRDSWPQHQMQPSRRCCSRGPAIYTVF